MSFWPFLAFFAWVFGAWMGHALEAKRWRDNADEDWRIESRGRLFKVMDCTMQKLDSADI